MKTARFTVEVTFDETKTDEEGIATALDRMMWFATNDPELLEDYGDVHVGEFFPEGT